MALVVRREEDGVRRYVHLSTGNYNATTARIYTDIGLLTSRPDIGTDASELFNRLTGTPLVLPTANSWPPNICGNSGS